MAQRVGAIVNYQPSDGTKPATFEVIEPGKDKGMKCQAWPTTGGKDNPRPNPVIGAIEGMNMAQAKGPWLVSGYEKKESFTAKDGTFMEFRRFYATDVTPAPPGAANQYDLDRDGNPIGAAPQNGSSNATNGHADDTASWALLVLLAKVYEEKVPALLKAGAEARELAGKSANGASGAKPSDDDWSTAPVPDEVAF